MVCGYLKGKKMMSDETTEKESVEQEAYQKFLDDEETIQSLKAVGVDLPKKKEETKTR